MRFLATTFWHAVLFAGLWYGDPMIVNITIFSICTISWMLIIGSATIITGKRHVKFEYGINLDPFISVWTHIMALAIVVSLAANGWFVTAGILLTARWMVGTANKAGRDAVEAKMSPNPDPQEQL